MVQLLAVMRMKRLTSLSSLSYIWCSDTLKCCDILIGVLSDGRAVAIPRSRIIGESALTELGRVSRDQVLNAIAQRLIPERGRRMPKAEPSGHHPVYVWYTTLTHVNATHVT